METNEAGDIIHFAEHREQAGKILEQCVLSDHLPCIVVLDLNMPRMNGTETLRLIRARAPQEHFCGDLFHFHQSPGEGKVHVPEGRMNTSPSRIRTRRGR